MYETFEHTADIGLRARAPDLETLFADVGRALFSVLVEAADRFPAEMRREVAVDASRLDDLLFDWLSELLYFFHSDGLVLSSLDVRLETDEVYRVRAAVCGGRLDPDRDPVGIEVKAITYHGMKVERTSDGYLAEVIVDI